MDPRRRSHREPTVLMWGRRSTPRNFLATSKAKALQGLKIVLNLTLRSKLALLIACAIIVGLSYVYIESLPANEITNSYVRRHHPAMDIQSVNTAVLYLQRPQRPFHGNHWYHIGEYYISRQEAIHQLLSKYHTKHPIRHLKLIVHDYRLTKTMTKMSFTLIVLSVLGQLSLEQKRDITSIELFAPKSTSYYAQNEHIHDIVNIRNGSVVTVVEKSLPLFGYYFSNAEGVQIVNYAESGLYIDRKATFEDYNDINDGMVEYQPTKTLQSATNWLHSWTLYPVELSHACNKNPCRDALYMGSIGDVPIPPVGWFYSSQQANNFRTNALSMCNINKHTTHSSHAATRTYTMIVYQRDLNRRFIHLNKVVETLKSHTMDGAKWNIEILRHRENMDPCALIKAFHSADILLTAHGFQSTASMFMKREAVLIEIFPYKYHRTTYLPLSRRFGLHYRSIQNTAPTSHRSSSLYTNLVSTIDANTPSTQLLRVISQGACMRDLKCRSYARSRDISMPQSHIELVLHTMWEVATDSLDPYAPTMVT